MVMNNKHILFACFLQYLFFCNNVCDSELFQTSQFTQINTDVYNAWKISLVFLADALKPTEIQDL